MDTNGMAKKRRKSSKRRKSRKRKSSPKLPPKFECNMKDGVGVVSYARSIGWFDIEPSSEADFKQSGGDLSWLRHPRQHRRNKKQQRAYKKQHLDQVFQCKRMFQSPKGKRMIDTLMLEDDGLNKVITLCKQYNLI